VALLGSALQWVMIRLEHRLVRWKPRTTSRSLL
jgi:hypothetical protein